MRPCGMLREGERPDPLTGVGPATSAGQAGGTSTGSVQGFALAKRDVIANRWPADISNEQRKDFIVFVRNEKNNK